jgi:tetratricopeptide (TPR) repeat protein
VNSETTKKRFQYWRLSGTGQINGMLPIPAGQEPSYFVELEYNPSGQVVAVREWFEGHPEPLVRKPVFTSKRLSYSDYVDPIDGFKGRNCYEYDKRGFLSQRYELDPAGKQRFRFEVRCDDQGRFVEERQFDKRQRLKERHLYEHDGGGRQLKDSVYAGKDGSILTGYFTFAYDARGNISRRAWHDAAGNEKHAFVYAYDRDDRRTSIAIEQGGRATTSMSKGYDALGRSHSLEYRDGEGALFARETLAAGVTQLRESLREVPEAELSASERALLSGEKTLASLMAFTPEQLRALATVAFSHLERGRFTQAKALFEALALLEPDNVYALSGVAAALLSQKHPEAALTWYERALSHDDGHAPSLAGKAEALIALGRIDEALGTFRVLLEQPHKPEDAPILRRAQAIVVALSKG